MNYVRFRGNDIIKVEYNDYNPNTEIGLSVKSLIELFHAICDDIDLVSIEDYSELCEVIRRAYYLIQEEE